MSRESEISDIGRHLDQQISGRVTDAMELLMIAGHQPLVGCAVTLASAQSLLETAIVMWLSQLPRHRRDDMFEVTLEKVLRDVREKKPKLFAALDQHRGSVG